MDQHLLGENEEYHSSSVRQLGQNKLDELMGTIPVELKALIRNRDLLTIEPDFSRRKVRHQSEQAC